jgi:hypothetical protein
VRAIELHNLAGGVIQAWRLLEMAIGEAELCMYVASGKVEYSLDPGTLQLHAVLVDQGRFIASKGKETNCLRPNKAIRGL